MMTEKLVVIGAGVMGRGIAHVAALSGYEAALVDLDKNALTAARSAISNALDKGIARGKITDADRQRTLEQLTFTDSLVEVAREASIVIEAVPEVLALKQSIFKTLEDMVSDDTLLGTNTSSLSIGAIASVTRHPERVIGTHFFNPVHILKLLEIVTAESTSEAYLQRTRDMGTRMSREMIVVRDSPGFATSRLGLVIGLEAIRMLEAGVASAEDIDRAMELGYRHPMGPLRLTDLVGLDTRLQIAEHLHRTLGAQFSPPDLLRQMVADGKLGKKSGEGFYRW